MKIFINKINSSILAVIEEDKEMRASGMGKGVWFDPSLREASPTTKLRTGKLTNRGKEERLDLFLFPLTFNLFPCLLPPAPYLPSPSQSDAGKSIMVLQFMYNRR
ncbi:hypothetical protein NSTC745_02649 [Nostoc sp. DSM 114161]|jgi:hypothetical protein